LQVDRLEDACRVIRPGIVEGGGGRIGKWEIEEDAETQQECPACQREGARSEHAPGGDSEDVPCAARHEQYGGGMMPEAEAQYESYRS
jgi:hypothetical protein